LLHAELSKRLGFQTRFDVVMDFAEFRKRLLDGSAAWGYVNPADYMKLRAAGYRPLARPATRPDRAILVAPVDFDGGPDPVRGRRVAAVDGYILALARRGLVAMRSEHHLVQASSYAQVLNTLRVGGADLGVLYGEYFDGITPIVRDEYKVLETCDPGITHAFVVHPEVPPDVAAALKDALVGLATGPQARLLGELRLGPLEEIGPEIEATYASCLG
jgi:ABC-type phosphate/phosphonate transport system substrate-binding protein